MEILKTLMSQDTEVLIPLFILAMVILNQLLKLVMTVVRVGAILSLVMVFLTWLPHLR
ncbi:MAG TPA: hypothetical protein PLW48_02055 [Alphaproteobacteria bacterium]|nr:hypothetical protein [Alphaproteobacteria bacterium]